MKKIITKNVMGVIGTFDEFLELKFFRGVAKPEMHKKYIFLKITKDKKNYLVSIGDTRSEALSCNHTFEPIYFARKYLSTIS